MTIDTGACAFRCDEGCSIDMPIGADTTVSVIPTATSYLAGIEGCAGTTQGCVLRPDSDAVVTVTLGLSGHSVFTTSSVYAGDLGGVEGANAICAEHARKAGLMDSTWVALLYGALRLEGRQVDTGAWVRLDGRPVRDVNASIAVLNYPIDRDEHGQELMESTGVWSGMTGADCGAFLSASGSLTGSIRLASAQQVAAESEVPVSCEELHPITCVQVDAIRSPVPGSPGLGRYVFVTRKRFVPASATPEEGLVRADEHCRTEACERGLYGKSLSPNDCESFDARRRFKALLSTTSDSALRRLRSRAIYVRPDGLPWTDSTDSLTDGRTLTGLVERMHFADAPIAAFAGYRGGPAELAASPDDTCNDWMGASNGYARGIDASSSGIRSLDASCVAGSRLICLEDPDETAFD